MSKVDSWSYTWVSRAKCWLQMYWLRYAPKQVKVVSDFTGPAAEEGKRIHDNIEQHLLGKGKLDPELHTIKNIVAMHKDDSKGPSYPEYAINVTDQWEPCAYDDWDRCWLRVRIDALKINNAGTKVLVDDWKTGKNQKVDELQLQLYAVAIFKARQAYEQHGYEEFEKFKDVEVVNARFVWTKSGDKDVMQFKYEDVVTLWTPFKDWLKQRERNKTRNDWPANPSHACNWCDARDVCKHG